jgi:glycosyltransferase involved in cell wall biosynthesis
MKLIIQIPCFNEEKYLPITVAELPKEIKGIDTIETLVIDDGSTDRTIKVAEALHVDHILTLKYNRGLAEAFSAGIEKCLEEGADIIVNTDADNQYSGGDIQKLVKPILDGKVDIVIGDRQTDKISHFPFFKKKLLKIGGWFVRNLVHIDVEDVVSGFRAYSRDAALRVNILSDYSYTLENLIQLKHRKYNIISVPVKTNDEVRESRLIKSAYGYMTSQLSTLLRIYTTYKPLKVFTIIGILIAIPGLLGLLRFLYYFFWLGTGKGHIQSLVFSVIFINVGVLVLVVGILADLISNNRKLIEKILYRQKKKDYQNKKPQ